MIAQDRRQPSIFVLKGRTASVKPVIDKHDTVADETMGADGDQLTDERMGLNPCVGTDFGAFLNFDKRPNEAIRADLTAIKVGGLNDRHIATERHIDDAGFHDPRFMVQVFSP